MFQGKFGRYLGTISETGTRHLVEMFSLGLVAELKIR